MNELELVGDLQNDCKPPSARRDSAKGRQLEKANDSLTVLSSKHQAVQQANLHNTSGKVGTNSELEQERAVGVKLRAQNMSMHAFKSSPMSRAAKNQDTMNMSVNRSVLDNSVCFADQASYGDFYKQMKSKFFAVGGRSKNINILDGLKDDSSQRLKSGKSKADRSLARQSETGLKETKTSSMSLLRPIQIKKPK